MYFIIIIPILLKIYIVGSTFNYLSFYALKLFCDSDQYGLSILRPKKHARPFSIFSKLISVLGGTHLHASPANPVSASLIRSFYETYSPFLYFSFAYSKNDIESLNKQSLK